MSLNLILNRSSNPHSFDPSTSIPDLTNKTILITGANAGLGLATLHQLSLHNPAKLYLACRTLTKFNTAITTLRTLHSIPSSTLATIHFLELDLASFTSIRAAATHFQSTNNSLDILICNAGVMGQPAVLTSSGYEIHFGVNFMGHALLTQLLLPVLQRTAQLPDVPKDSVRVVNVSSMGFGAAGSGVLLDSVKTEMKDTHSLTRYGISKLAQIQWTRECNRRYEEVLSVVVHPGRVETGLLNEHQKRNRWGAYALFQWAYDKVIGAVGVEEGALCQLWAATAGSREEDEGKGPQRDGVLYVPVGVNYEGNSYCKDEEASKKLWEWTQQELEAES